MDFLLPKEMAAQAEQIGVNKIKMPIAKTLVLAVLAGAFIALGAAFFTSVTAASEASYGFTRLLGGLAFSLGLILVIIGGAELFTGNNLIVMAWANKGVSTRQLLWNWLWVYLGNMFGALFIATLVFFSKVYSFAGGKVGLQMLNIAKAKCELNFVQAISLGILCNILVCLAVWLCFSAKSTSGRILSILFPISAFVTCGFEHSIANMYFIPEAIFVKNFADDSFITLMNQSGIQYDTVSWSHFLIQNLLPVTIGNIFGGAVLVGLVYWFVFLKGSPKNTPV